MVPVRHSLGSIAVGVRAFLRIFAEEASEMKDPETDNARIQSDEWLIVVDETNLHRSPKIPEREETPV